MLSKEKLKVKLFYKNIPKISPFSKLDLFPVLQCEKLPPDKRIVVGVHICSDKWTPPVNLWNNTVTLINTVINLSTNNYSVNKNHVQYNNKIRYIYTKQYKNNSDALP